ncbi:MAG: DUF362 domain-containing protein [Thermodesulfobacteriota bacterium]
MGNDVNRREAMFRLAKLCGIAAVTAGAYGASAGRSPVAARPEPNKKTAQFRINDAPNLLVVAKARGKYEVETLVRKALEPWGGMGRFIKRGDVVAVKPNLSWDRPPELAANTNPAVLAALVKMCQEAGAAKVNIVDHTINDARRCFASTGAEAAARATGAHLIHPSSHLFKNMNLEGRRLGEWAVFTPVLEADKLINAPVAKSHGLSLVTLGMKNWLGAVGGSRGALHQDIHQSIADLAAFFQPTLTVLDATRVMLANGPSGGRLADVAAKDTIIAGQDQVAVDAAALPLFGLVPEQIGFLLLGQEQGLGRLAPAPGQRLDVMA